ncbi:MAG TPA: peroxidase family protein, partial [Myxococcaceae bacterium]|nr:peroxidase family protein [Myxococcaceae bacterium]
PKTHLEKSGETNNWWSGQSLLHTLIAKEHNAIVDRLQLEYPTWSGERLFHTARLINTALMAKIHTVEWTPAILGHPTLRIAMNANWWGLFSEHITRLFGRLSRSEELSGIPGAPLDHHGVPYSLTEEFVAVYRMHSLMPDSIRWHRVEDGRFVREDSLPDVSGVSTRSAFEGGLSADDLCYSFGIQHPGALVLHNYPGFLRKLPQRDEDGAEAPIDLAAIDVLRDRERGIPRYNTFRRLLHLRPARSFDDITSNPQWARELREVYGDVERVDMMVGTLAEDRPQGFGFSDTQFRVFILMASRRLASDRFFTTDYNVNVYSRVGMEWINDNTMCSVVLRHYPDIAPAIRQVKNAFAPWVPIAAWQPRPSRTLH